MSLVEFSKEGHAPIIFFVLPCYNEAEGLSYTANVLMKKFQTLLNGNEISTKSRIFL